MNEYKVYKYVYNVYNTHIYIYPDSEALQVNYNSMKHQRCEPSALQKNKQFF